MNYSSYYKERSRKASERARRGWITRHAEMERRGPSVEDEHSRMLEDRRGDVFASLQCVNHASGKVTRLVLRYSVRGRSDQFDVCVNGKLMNRPRGLSWIFKKWSAALAAS